MNPKGISTPAVIITIVILGAVGGGVWWTMYRGRQIQELPQIETGAYVHSGLGLSFELPENWVVSTQSSDSVTVAETAVIEFGSVITFTKTNQTLEEILQGRQQHVGEDFQIVSRGSVTITGVSGEEVIFQEVVGETKLVLLPLGREHLLVDAWSTYFAQDVGVELIIRSLEFY